MKIISSLIGSVVLLLAVSFALSNRQSATVSLWPFDVSVQAPLCLLTLGCLIIGLLSGSLIVWLGMLPHRFAARRLHADIVALHDKLDSIKIERPVADVNAAPLHRRLWSRYRNFGA